MVRAGAVSNTVRAFPALSGAVDDEGLLDCSELAGQTPAIASVTHLNFGAPGSGDNVEAGVNNHYLNAKNHRNSFDGLLHKLLDLDQTWLHKGASQPWTTETYKYYSSNTIRQTIAYSFRVYVNCSWGYSLQGIPFTVRARPGSQGTDQIPKEGHMLADRMEGFTPEVSTNWKVVTGQEGRQ
jgi:hypothetical protein